MKFSLVVAGLGDLMRPADKLSLNQSISLAATGLIWTRVSFCYIFCNNFFSILCFQYCMVIIPKNYFLGLVNFSLGLTGLQQLIRIAHYHYTHPNQAAIN